jgi:hypothetical protein
MRKGNSLCPIKGPPLPREPLLPDPLVIIPEERGLMREFIELPFDMQELDE